jgi:hypothetical protein
MRGYAMNYRQFLGSGTVVSDLGKAKRRGAFPGLESSTTLRSVATRKRHM